MTVESRQEALLHRLGRQVRDASTAYTRAYGPEDNSLRVLGLLEMDTFVLGNRIIAVLVTGEDPGDQRYPCGFGACRLRQGHSAEHDPPLV